MSFSRFLVILFTALCLFGCGQTGEGKKISATDTIKPTKPGSLIAKVISESSVRLTWEASTDNWGIKGYRIYRKGIEIATVNDISYTDSGLTPSTNYCYQVAAIDKGDNESEKSTEVCTSTSTGTKTLTTKTFGNPGAGIQILKSVSDTKNNIYLKGDFTGTVDFNPGSGEDIKTSPTDGASFITKINVDGTYAWTRIFGSLLTATAIYQNENEISVTSDGTVYTCCSFQQTADFNPEGGHDYKTSSGNLDIAITKINPDGAYAWTKIIGSSGLEAYPLCHIDKYDNLYICGNFGSATSFNINFDITGGNDIKNFTGNALFQVFLTKINSDGRYAWTKIIGNSSVAGDVLPSAVKTDKTGNVYLAGMFVSPAGCDFDPGPGQDIKITPNNNGSHYYNFITRINSDSSYGWTQIIDTHTLSMDNLIAIDNADNIYISGFFNTTTDFNPDSGSDIKTSEGGANPFISKINANGTYAWTRTVPLEMSYPGDNTASNTPYIHGLYYHNNKIYMTGSFDGSSNFKEGGNDIIDAAQYGRGLFTTRINLDGSYDSTKILSDYMGSQLFFTNSGVAFLGGSFSGTLDIDPSTSDDNVTSLGDYDGFLFQLTDSFFK